MILCSPSPGVCKEEKHIDFGCNRTTVSEQWHEQAAAETAEPIFFQTAVNTPHDQTGRL